MAAVWGQQMKDMNQGRRVTNERMAAAYSQVLRCSNTSDERPVVDSRDLSMVV